MATVAFNKPSRNVAACSLFLFMLPLLSCAATGSPQREIALHKAGAVPPTFFSMTIGHVTTTTPWPSLPLGGIRTWDSSKVAWSILNPSRGVYDWSNLDALLNLAQAHGVDVLYTFGRTPQWASSDPTQKCDYSRGACLPPANMQDWDDYVKAITTHAAGRIKYWEIWNEANQREYWSGNVQDLVAMAHHAYSIIKSIDPTAKVLTPSAVGGAKETSKWLDLYFASGGGAYADVVAFHGYGSGQSGSIPESVNAIVDAVQKTMSMHGQSSKPVWDTEGSWGPGTRLPDEDDQAAFVARHYILQWAKGVQRYYWYAWDDTRFGTMWDWTSGIRKPGIAFGEVYRWLVGATMTTPCAMATDFTWTCAISKSGGYEAQLVWNASGSRPYKPASQFKQYRQLDGKASAVSGFVPIGAKPILLENERGR